MTDIQKLEFEILQKTIAFLEENQLNYFLVGGSLLGAIRHNGFIPWDDDIDIGMQREDYEKLISICSKMDGKIDENLKLLSYKINDNIYPYSKIVNTSVKITEDSGLDEYLWIDIFPFDYLPKNSFITKIIYRKENILKRLLFVKNMDANYLNKASKTRIKYFFKKIAIKVFLKKLKPITLAKKMDKLAVKTNQKNQNSGYSGCMVWGYGLKEKILSSDLKIKKVIFEGMQVNGIEGYNHYLSNLYGDYMQLPRENKRVSHSFKIEKISDN